MDKMDSVSREERLSQAKRKIKAWEGEYKSIHGCAPNKAAMAEAPEEVKASYKIYRHYRKALENLPLHSGSENVEVSKDPKEGGEIENATLKIFPGFNEEKSLPCDLENTVTEPPKNQSQNNETTKVTNNDKNGEEKNNCRLEGNTNLDNPQAIPNGVWGSHLNKANTEVKKEKKIQNSLYSKMADKLWAGSSVKVRTSLKRPITTQNKPPPPCKHTNDTKTVSTDQSTMLESSKASQDIDDKSLETTNLNQEPQSPFKDNEEFLENNCIRKSSLESANLDQDSQSTAENNDQFLDNTSFRETSSLSLFDTLESNNITVPVTFSSGQNKKQLNSLALSAVSPANIFNKTAEIPTIKKRSSLNLGWVARCTGTEITERRSKDIPSDEWKMKLVDKDYVEGESDDEEESSMGTMDDDLFEDSCSSPVRNKTRGRRGRGNPVRKTNNKRPPNKNKGETDNTAESSMGCGTDEDPVINDPDEEGSISPVRGKTRGRRNPVRRTNKRITTNNKLHNVDSDDDRDYNADIAASEFQDKDKTSAQKLSEASDPFDFDHEIGDTEYNDPSNLSRCNLTNQNDEIFDDNEKEAVDDNEKEAEVEERNYCSRKRKKQTLEELEESGKIQSVWPPPKKKRVARVRSKANTVPKIKKKEGSIETPTRVQTRRKPATKSKLKPKEIQDAPDDVFDETEDTQTPAKAQTRRKQVTKSKVKPNETQKQAIPNDDYDETEDIESHGKKSLSKGKWLAGEERMQKKISSGTLNSNFVRINLKKKTYVRGKKTMTGAKFKRQEWKKKQFMKSAEKGDLGAQKALTCFRCGDFGHWAKRCPGKIGDGLMPLEEYDEKESTFLSLEDAAALAMGIKPSNDKKNHSTRVFPSSQDGDIHQIQSKDNEEMQATSDTGLSPSNQTQEDDREMNTTSDISPSKLNFFQPENGEINTNTSEISNNDSFSQPDNGEINTDTSESNNQIFSQPDSGNSTGSEHFDIQSSSSVKEQDYPETEETQIKETTQASSNNLHDSDDDMFADIDMENIEEKDISLSQNTSLNSASQSNVEKPAPYVSYSRPSVDPLYDLVDGKLCPTPKEVYEVLNMFGYSSFRPGQEEAIMRVLSGQSTLLVLSTGSGKSLCYQLPAFIFARHKSPCVTLCVSPLVSLMEDQVSGLPGFLNAVCLHTNQNTTQRSKAMSAIQNGSAHIILVSPEAVVASRSGGVLGSLLRELPPVAFACLDEAHCVSEWSHNFRPSYLRVCQVLRDRLGVKTILGLTATARHFTALSIAGHLHVPDFDTGIIRGRNVPDNLYLSVSRDQFREQALITLLQGERFSECNSIIIYCTRRDECEKVASLIRMQLLDPSKVDVKSNLKRRRAISYDAEAYHAGLSAHRRNQVQKRFMSGSLRIVVATVAFGMGIDKSDVRGIIHYNMPKNLESYVQEIGRAGRDGEDAHCHLFLDAQDGIDIQELKRHIYANSIDRHTIRKLLDKIFKPCACVKVKNLESGGSLTENDTNIEAECTNSDDSCTDVVPSINKTGNSNNTDSNRSNQNTRKKSSCPKHEVGIPIDDVIEALDLPEENLETLLCYLDLHQTDLIHLNSHAYANCNVSCYAGPRQLVAVSRRCPPLAVAIALERQKGVNFDKKSRVSFPVIEVASRMGWNSKIVKRELKGLEWDTRGLSSGGKIKKSGVMVEFTDLSFHMDARGDLSNDERDQILDAMFTRCRTQEKDQIQQLMYTYQLLRQASHNSIMFCCDTVDSERCEKLRLGLRQYFSVESKNLPNVNIEEKLYVRPEVETGVRSSVRALLSTHTDQQWTGRAVARVFHGIGSPNFPTEVWGRVRRFWRQHLNTDFNLIVKFATQEILRCK